MKKKISAILVVMALLITVGGIFSVVHASSTSYTSSLSVDGNSTCTGATRQYNESNYKISLYPNSITYNTKMLIELVKKNWITSTSWYSVDAYFTSTGKTYTYNMGSHSAAKCYYYFSTFGSGYYGSINANPVTMTSYS